MSSENISLVDCNRFFCLCNGFGVGRGREFFAGREFWRCIGAKKTLPKMSNKANQEKNGGDRQGHPTMVSS